MWIGAGRKLKELKTGEEYIILSIKHGFLLTLQSANIILTCTLDYAERNFEPY